MPRHAFAAIAIASAIVLFTPASALQILGLDAIRATHRTWIGGAFVLSAALFFTSVAGRLAQLVAPDLIQRWNASQQRKALHTLSRPEREVLAEYLLHDTSTRSFAISDGVVGGLVAKRILYRASNVGHPGSMSFDHNLQPWAWDYLRRHPALVQPNPSSP